MQTIGPLASGTNVNSGSQAGRLSATIRLCVGEAMSFRLEVGSEANALLRRRVDGIAT